MERKKMISIGLVALSLVYGATLAVLGMLGSGATSLVALIGAMTIGVGWVVYGAAFTGEQA